MSQNMQAQIDNVKDEIVKIGNTLLLSNKMLLQATSTCECDKSCNKEKFTQAKLEIKYLLTYINDIDNNIMEILALHTPSTQNLRYLVSYLKITNDIARASYSTKSFIKKFTMVCDNLDIAIINEYATPMQTATIKALELAISMLSIDDMDDIDELYEAVVIEENKSDDIYALVEKNLILQAKESDDTLKYHQMLRALRKSAKIASRSVSIANLLVYAKAGGNFHN